MRKTTFLFLLFLFSIFMNNGIIFADECKVCPGLNLSVAYTEHSERLYIRIGDSPPIYFYKPDKPPKIIANGLDKNKKYIIRVYFDNKVVRS